MCFSATASFIAGSSLTVLGVATLRLPLKSYEVPFASIPLLFGLQQFIEGMLWLSFHYDAPLLNMTMTYLFSIFSHVLWPIFVPFAIGMLETVPWRRNVTRGFQMVGLFVGLYLLYMLIEYPVTAIAGENIVYVSPHFYKLLIMALYVAATCISCFFSSITAVRYFGGLALGLFLVAYGFYSIALFSVWCFFAAVLSSIIYVHFRFGLSLHIRPVIRQVSGK